MFLTRQRFFFEGSSVNVLPNLKGQAEVPRSDYYRRIERFLAVDL